MLRDHRYAAALAAIVFAAAQSAAQAAPPSHILTSGCEEQELSLQYPAEAFKKLMPPGFKVATLDPTGLIASVDISVDQCNSVDNGPGSQDFLAFVEVTPPVQYQQAGVIAYGLLLNIWSTRTKTVDTFTDWGFGDQAAVGEIDVGPGLDLDGRKTGTIRASGEDSKITTTTVLTARKSSYASGTTRAFALDSAGKLHILDATWTDQTFQAGIGTFLQNGKAPLPLPLIVQAYPVLVGHASDYDLSLHWIQ